jgi:UrcA family protein
VHGALRRITRRCSMTVFAKLIAAAAIAITAVPALATEAPRSVRVATQDLNLSSAQGQRTLDLRLARAASQLCDTVDPRYDAAVRVAQRQCREATIAAARSNPTNPIRIAAR